MLLVRDKTTTRSIPPIERLYLSFQLTGRETGQQKLDLFAVGCKGCIAVAQRGHGAGSEELRVDLVTIIEHVPFSG
jgi:hypothetical protein